MVPVNNHIMRRLYNILPAGLQRFSSHLWLYWRGFLLLLATITGYIPSHRIRLFLYRYLFGVRIGSYSTIHWQCRFFEPAGVQIGSHTIIGNNAFLDGRRGLMIGDCVVTASEVAIYTLQHDVEDPYLREFGSSVVIEDYVYIGPRVIILPGVRVGEGGVIAAGAVVTKDVEAYTMVAGVPAEFVKYRPHDLRYKPSFRMPFQ